jgi:hypothetical protein
MHPRRNHYGKRKRTALFLVPLLAAPALMALHLPERGGAPPSSHNLQSPPAGEVVLALPMRLLVAELRP